jgi:outer membrane autotransporter protein
MDKKSKFKKFLTTTSALAIVVGGVSSAMAANFQSNGGVLSKLADGQAVVGAVSVPGGTPNWTAGDNFNLNAGFDLDLGIIAGNHPVTVGTITVTHGGRTINVLEHASAISVANGGQTAAVIIADNMNFTLNGIVQTGLGNITIGAGGGGTESLIINAGTALAPVVLGGTIDGGGANEGTITINANKAVTFNAAIGGGQPLKAITLAAGSIANINAAATVGTNGAVLTGATAQLNLGNGVVFTGKVTANGANEGILNFVGAGEVTLQAGNGNALKEIRASGAGIVALSHAAAVAQAETLTIANAGTTDVQLAGGFTGAVKYSANGTVTLADTKVITGAITTTSGGADGLNGGKLVIKLSGEVAGAIGTAANRLDTVQLTGAGNLHLSTANANHYARQFLFKDNAAMLKVAAGGVIHGDAVANANGNGVVRFLGAGEYDGRIGDGPAGFGLAMFEANGAGIVKVGAGEHKAVVFTLTNGASEFEFANGANLTANINNASGGANNTKVKFTGSGSVSGTTGTAVALSELNLTGDVNSVVKFGGTTKATNINIGAGTLEMNNAGDLVGITNFTDVARGGNLLISGAGAHLVNGAVVTGVGAGGGKGTITIANSVGANAVTFKGQIGDHAVVDNALKLLSIDSADSVNFTGANNSQITAISFGANTANTGILNFAEANATYKIGGITAVNNKGILKITENTTFESAANNAAVTFGTNDAKLHKVVFENGKTLVVGDGISIYATTVHATNDTNGVLSFAGSSTFSATGVNANRIATINVNGGAGKVVKLLDVTDISGNATVANGGTLEIANNFTAGNLRGGGVGQGTVRFTNGAAMTVTGTVGAGASLAEIEFKGGDVSFANAVTHAANKAFTFTSDTATTVTFTNAATDVGNNNFVNNSANGIRHTVVLKNALTTFNAVQLAADAGKQINFQLSNGVDAKINGATVALGANFTTDTATKGYLELNAANVVINSAGAFGKNLAKVQFTLEGGITNGLFAEQVIVAAAKTATIGGRIVSGDFSLAGDNSKVILSNGAIVDAAIKATVPNKGLVEFAGGATLNQDIGTGANKAASVTFADDAQFIASLNTANIFADTIALRKGVVSLSQNITLNGATTVASTPLALGDKKLTVAAGNTLAFSGNNNIAFDVTVNGDTATGGQIASLGVLEFDPATTIVVRPNDAKNSRPTAGKTRSFTLISSAANVANGKTLDLTKVTMDDSVNPFTKWTPTIDGTGGLALTQEDNAKQVIMDLLGTSLDATDKTNIEALTSAAQGTDAAKIVDLLSSLTDSSGKLVKAKVDETLDRLPPVSTVSDAIETASGAVSMGLSQRMTNLAGSQGTPVQSRTVASSDAAMSGIAAGDEGARYGAWISPFFGKTTQKERKGAAGYKSSSYGASFGFDTRANDDMIIGGAVTVANNEMKHRNFKSGDKTKISSMMFSIYGMQQITDSWFAHGVATFGSNDVKNSERRVSGLTTYDTVSGKYTSMSFNGEAMFGYNFLTEQVTFTPMAGLRYSRVNDGGYKETGSTTGQNLDVNTKASNKLEVVAGARVAGGTFGMNGMTVTPEIHGFINHDIIGKNPKQTLGLAGTNGLAVKSNKPVKTTFNVGVGVNFAYNMMEYGAGYDAEIANKRLGHQGTLKLRVNF